MADITPSKRGYKRILNVIINHSTNDDDRAWAEAELERIE
ncbi:unnamed protein product [marine sediment metagenome]|uniref:Uncharacterized protein n=1 Tax=marine sediment metagenome TaxID=412755 RepID=X1D3G9_9ZZZZ